MAWWRLLPPGRLRLDTAQRLQALKPLALVALAVLLLVATAAHASTAGDRPQSVLSAEQRRVAEAFAQTLADEALKAHPGAIRSQAIVADADSRLRLAPCQQVRAHLPAGVSPWGRTRIGLRCEVGDSPWNIHLGVQIQVFGPALVAARPLSAGSSLAAADFTISQADWAADRSAPLQDAQALVGRELQRQMVAGEPVRQHHLRARLWFNTGETVKLVARGPGYQVISSGQALTPGVEGQAIRVRTDNGRIVTGAAIAERLVELPL